MAISAPDASTRWRCSRCGNLTRFDVVRATRSQQFWHFDLGGTPVVEQTDPLHDEIESVTCRWCGAADCVELVERATDG